MNSKQIIPAILPVDYFDLEKHLERTRGVTKYVQIDIADGLYTQSKTWPFTHTPDIYYDKIVSGEEGMPFWKDIDFELDLMIKNPEEMYTDLLQLGPTRMIFHFETLTNPIEFIQKIKEEGLIEIGLAFSNDTDVTEHFDVIDLADVVQCMGIAKIGFQGQEFDERVFDQIKKIKDTFPDKKIAVDGSVNFDTIEALSDAGVSNFAVGSAFFGTENLVETFEDLEDLL